MGKLYYAELRGLYKSSSDPGMDLQIDNENEAEHPGLVAALTPLYARRRNYELAMQFLATGDVVSQKILSPCLGLACRCPLAPPWRTLVWLWH